MSDALFVWNDGAKLFIGSSNQYVQIYTLNSTNQLYILPPAKTPNLGGNVYSTYVNLNGTIIYAATYYGCKKIEWNGTNWNINTPPYL